MTFDASLPLGLKQTQEWFASIITRPISLDSKMDPMSPSGRPMEEEAKIFIKPSPTLRPAERIELYNQQYWWRLLSVLQENFPLTTRLFGYHDFNRLIAFPYLTKYCSRDWSLNKLGDRLMQWIQEEYRLADRKSVFTAASIDWAFCYSFGAAEHKPIGFDSLPLAKDMASLLTAPLYLQPHIHLFALEGDYFALRTEMLKQPVEYWVENDFPVLAREQKTYFYVLFRDKQNNLAWNALSEAQYELLSRFQAGSSVDACCDWLARRRKKVFSEAKVQIHHWFQEWVARHWLTLHSDS